MEEKFVTLQIPVALKEYTDLVTIKKTYGFKSWRALLNSLIENKMDEEDEMDEGRNDVDEERSSK